ncbi:MAG: hypothetical protein A2103_04885 [Gammaproteobacteria bacterium GWF2_41_13]|nr:MAG: hypothetical protein A2103_04885 [Gammaproteobacteria bacterium GWF2_41_13]
MLSIILFIILSILGGLAAGWVAGLFGIGGGSISVPLFLITLPLLGAKGDLVMHQAIATSLIVIVPSAFSATRKQYKQRNINVKFLFSWLPWVVVGVVGASFFIIKVPAKTLEILFAAYLFLAAVYIFFKGNPKVPQDHVPKGMIKNIGAILVGVISTFLGIGGGTFTVPFLIACKYPLVKSIAISSATGLVIGLFGSICAAINGLGQPNLALFSIGYVNILAACLMAPFSMYTAQFGAKLSHEMNPNLLKILYSFFLLLVVLYMCWEVFGK